MGRNAKFKLRFFVPLLRPLFLLPESFMRLSVFFDAGLPPVLTCMCGRHLCTCLYMLPQEYNTQPHSYAHTHTRCRVLTARSQVQQLKVLSTAPQRTSHPIPQMISALSSRRCCKIMNVWAEVRTLNQKGAW